MQFGVLAKVLFWDGLWGACLGAEIDGSQPAKRGVSFCLVLLCFCLLVASLILPLWSHS